MGNLEPRSLGSLAFPALASCCSLSCRVHEGGLGELIAWDTPPPQLCKVTFLKSCLPFTRKGLKQETLRSTATKALALVISEEQFCDC